jgi:polysaccharide biosynthesis/export protein
MKVYKTPHMKTRCLIIATALLLLSGCATRQKLSYLTNLPETGGEQYFPLSVPNYKIQNRDVLYITLKAMGPDGIITDYLSSNSTGSGAAFSQGEGGGYLYGYNVHKNGYIILPVIDSLYVEGKELDEIRIMLQERFNKFYNNAIVECKLLSFRFTVIGEVRSPGTYVNYGNYLTALEAVSRAGGVNDYGRRDRILVVRTDGNDTKTYRINLQDKNLLTSETYFLLPNDLIIIEPLSYRIFNLNFPVVSSILTTVASLITTTVLLINYFGK